MNAGLSAIFGINPGPPLNLIGQSQKQGRQECRGLSFAFS
jgi:hypothetical protein